MAFKDQLAADLGSVFFPGKTGKPAEFDEAITIDGAYAVSCILDESEGQHSADGVMQWSATLYLAAEDLAMPVVDQRLVLTTATATRQAGVVGVDVTDGLLTIRLRWFDS